MRAIAYVAVLWLLALTLASVGQANTGPTIYIENRSTVIPNRVIADALPVWQASLSGEVARYWNVDARLVFVTGPKPAGGWLLTVEDYADVPGALGYHDYQGGAPYARVFAATAQEDQQNWEITLDHELKEMVVDPFVAFSILTPRGFYLSEVCDQVEADRYGYWRASPTGAPVALSDFVTPRWFQATSTGPYDFARHVRRPFQLLPDGYALKWMNGRWTQLQARA